VTALARLNGLSPSGVLLAGSTLTLPGPKLALRSYRVQSGDTLTAIAARFGCSPAVLARTNGMSLAQTLLSGAVIRVPAHAASATQTAGATYTVQQGDSLSSIALGHGVSLGALADLNRLALSDVLPVGRRLVLPANAITSTLGTFSRSTVRGSLVFWANHYEVDVHLVTALAWMESGFNNEMVSTAGAVGVMQVTPATWDYVEGVLIGSPIPRTADGNVRIGVAYLRHLLRAFGGSERLALAAYYQGPASVRKRGLLRETKAFVADVQALKQRM